MKFSDVFNLIIPDNFGSNEDTEDTYEIDKLYRQLDNTVKTAYGVSQFTIIFKDPSINQVVKIPFLGEWFYNDEEGEEQFDEYAINYTDLSVEIYEKAKDAGVEAIFAAIDYIGKTKNNYPLYAQEKVEYSYNDVRVMKKKPFIDPSAEELEEVHKHYDNFSYAWRAFTDVWVACAIRYYGLDLVLNFMDFLDENRIEDLHYGNYGYTAEGRPVIFDYCGFDY